jgi:ubiquinone/menaquinone biosynthesis C-methylase UbiE
MNNNQEKTLDYYRKYFQEKPLDRNSLLNPEVLLQSIAHEASIVQAFRSIAQDYSPLNIFYPGCGSGGVSYLFPRIGFSPSSIHGVDIMADRIELAKVNYPHFNFSFGDASRLDIADNSFDIVFESTMFLQIVDEELAKNIASEMVRITKPSGHIILADWRYGKPGDERFHAVNRQRIKNLFDVGRSTTITNQYLGALVPPVGRFLSKYLPWAYFPVQSLFPFLVGQVTTVLQKVANI